MYIRNLTPHSVTVAGITIEPSGIVARVSAATADAGSVDFNGTTIPLTTTVYGEVHAPVRGHQQGIHNLGDMPSSYNAISVILV